MINLPQFNATSLSKTFETLGQVIRSRSMNECIDDPVFVMIYQNIMSMSREELESAQDRWGQSNLYSSAKHVRNPLIFSALLEKRYQWNKACDEIKWLFDLIPQPSVKLFQNIYMYASVFPRTQDDMNEDNLFNDNGLTSLIFNHCQHMETTEEELLLSHYLNKYAIKYQDNIIHLIFTHHTKSEIVQSFTHYFKEHGINFNKNYPLDKFLPQEDIYNQEKNFFISSGNTPSITYLLEQGFQFNPEYRYQGKDLLNCIFGSGRKDLITGIAPYLTIQNDLTRQAQDIIEKNTEYAKIYEALKATQLKQHLDERLNLKTNKQKLKI